MPNLSEIQRDFASAILAGDVLDIATAPGRVSPAAALQVHRNTVVGALVNALRLTYPSVDALVGEAFFDQVAADFARVHPPATARLAGYGEAFANFLAVQVPTLAYLPDVARLDWALDRCSAAPDTVRHIELDGSVTLEWPVSLTVLSLNHPAGEIRAALGDDAALAVLDMTPAPRWLLVWRKGRQVMTRAASPPAAAFVDAILAEQGAQVALRAALAHSADALSLISSEIFAASFCTIGDAT